MQTSTHSDGAGLALRNPELLKQANLIGGSWVGAASGATIAVRNPASGEIIGTVPSLSRGEVESAIRAAYAAQAGWAAMTGKARAAILRRLFDLMMDNQDDLARIMTAEQGKPFAEARAEIAYGAAFVEWFAEEAKRVYGDTVPAHLPGKRLIVQKEPIGVFAAITPWNFPTAMVTRKAAPGWAAGCAGVIRPASETPFSALAIGALAEQTGLPAGVCNIVTGSSSDMGKELCENPLVRKLSFTGSTRVGALLLSQCAPTIKKTSMELGGNAPFIVFDDADLDQAVQGAMASKYRNTGQTCVCANRFYVQSGVYEEFADRLAAAIRTLRVGDGMATGVTQGPLINMSAVEKVEEHIADAVGRGARIAVGGQRHASGRHFFEPTLLLDVPAAAVIAREETFGPVAALIRFDTEQEAVAMANDTPFGLAAYFYSRDVARCFRVAGKLEAGIVGVNEGLVSTEVAPFGGVKQSGLGREGSKYGIEDYLELKYICIGGIDG